MNFGAPTSTPSNHDALLGRASVVAVRDPFDFDPFSMDPFTVDQSFHHKPNGSYGDTRLVLSSDPFGASEPLRSSTFFDLDGAPFGVLQSISGLTSSQNGCSGWVSFDTSTMSQTDGSSNVAFFVDSTTNGSGVRTDFSSDTDDLKSLSDTAACWTPDWSNGEVATERVAMDVAYYSVLDGNGSVWMNGDGYLTQRVGLPEAPVTGEANVDLAMHEAETVPEEDAADRSSLCIQSPTTSDGNSYAMTDAIDDILAAEYPETSAPKAEIEDDMLTPIGTVGGVAEVLSNAELDDSNVFAPGLNASDTVAGAVPYVDASPSGIAGCSAELEGHYARKPGEYAENRQLVAQMEFMDEGVSTTTVGTVAETRLILCGPLQIMGRSDLHASRTAHSIDGSPAMSPVQPHPPSSFSLTPSSAARPVASVSNTSLDGVENSGNEDTLDENAEIRSTDITDVVDREAACGRRSGSSGSEDGSLLVAMPMVDEPEFLEPLPEVSVARFDRIKDISRMRINVEPMRPTAANSMAAMKEEMQRMRESIDRASLDNASSTDSSMKANDLSRDTSCLGKLENQSLTCDPSISDSTTNPNEVIDGEDEVERQRGCRFESPNSAETLPDREETNVDGSHVILEWDLDDSQPLVELKTRTSDKFEFQPDHIDLDDSGCVPPFVESIDVKDDTTFEEFLIRQDDDLDDMIASRISGDRIKHGENIDLMLEDRIIDDNRRVNQMYGENKDDENIDPSLDDQIDSDTTDESSSPALDTTDEVFLVNKTLSDNLTDNQLDALLAQQGSISSIDFTIEDSDTAQDVVDDSDRRSHLGGAEDAVDGDEADVDVSGYDVHRSFTSSTLPRANKPSYNQKLYNLEDETTVGALQTYSVQSLGNRFERHRSTRGGDGQPSIGQVPPTSTGVETSSTCKQCGKRVYEMEKMTSNQTVYHKTCFRCNHCHRILSFSNFASIAGNVYCKPHFMEIFMTKGCYEDSSCVLSKDSSVAEYEALETSAASGRTSMSSSITETDTRISPKRLDEVSLVPVDAMRGIYEKLAHDAKIARKVNESSKKHHQKHDDYKQATARCSSSASAGSRTLSDRCSQGTSLLEEEEITANRAASATTLSPGGGRGITRSSFTSILPEELPPPSITKHLLEQFRLMEGARQPDHLDGRRSLGRTVSAPSTPVRRRVTTNLGPDAAAETQRHGHQQRSVSQSQFDRGNQSASLSDVCSDKIILSSNSQVLLTTSAAEDNGGNGMPRQGLTKALLTQWRHIEDRMRGALGGSGRGRSMATTSNVGVATTLRSQSMPRMRDGGQSRRSSSPTRSDWHVFGDEKPDEEQSTVPVSHFSSISEIVDVLPPPLMTQYMLAKFRDLEVESQIVSGLQANAKKSYKWEVKEATPLSHGIVEAPSKSPLKVRLHDPHSTPPQSDEQQSTNGNDETSPTSINGDGKPSLFSLRVSEVLSVQSSESDDFSSVYTSSRDENTVTHMDELPEPGITRSLLAKFQSMLQPRNK